MALTNNEKQERFRKKEYLKKIADEIFKNFQLTSFHNFSVTPQEIRHYLDKIVELPSNWTDEDFEHALQCLNNYQFELLGENPHALENNIDTARNSVEPFIMSKNSQKWLHDKKEAVKNMQNLTAHILSAINLANGTPSDSAAALIEVEKKLGRMLLNEKIIPQSQATTMCLATILPQFNRPDWFIEELTKTLKENLGHELSKKLGENLLK